MQARMYVGEGLVTNRDNFEFKVSKLDTFLVNRFGSLCTISLCVGATCMGRSLQRSGVRTVGVHFC